MEPGETHGNYAIQNHETALKVVRFASVNEPGTTESCGKGSQGPSVTLANQNSTRMDCD
jgi:hypothetical protein